MAPRKKKTNWTRAKKKKKKSPSDILQETFYDPQAPAGYAGADQVRRQARRSGVKPQQVDQWLRRQPGYTLHRPVRRRFGRRRVRVDGLDEQWQADLADVRKLSQANDGNEYLLIALDVLSRYAFVRPIKKKNAATVARAFEDIFEESDRQPDALQTDEGTEFLNSTLRGVLKERGIRHFVVYGDTKAQIVERFIRTFKNRMWRYFTAHNTHRYMDILQDLVKGYNAGFHRSIQRSPDSVTHANAQDVWRHLYAEPEKPKKRRRRYRFKPGDQVRLSKKAEAFKKGYTPGWTEEIFVVQRRVPGWPPLYKIKEWDGTPLSGSFYEAELQPVTVDETDTFRVEEVIRRRRATRTRPAEVLVKWRGWPDKYNSWIPESNVQET
ncbi:uncharacterized protein LOC110248614 [Exaiptasia diaphana]|uniref:Integrase catalytic domain-containing protein n=1 Tax=Exaiptasia diaphana TaxID=2652724 RepID=A0A913XV81_EXADI|nr:uncharacterized protein LOC110248614 [Exaiptasia diaphana]